MPFASSPSKNVKAAVFVLLFLAVAVMSYSALVPSLFLVDTLNPSGSIQQVSANGVRRMWSVIGRDLQTPGFTFDLQSGTTTRSLTLYIETRILRKPIVRFVADLGRWNTELQCEPYTGRVRTKYLRGERYHVSGPAYNVDIKFRCSDPSDPGSIIEGNLFFSGKR